MNLIASVWVLCLFQQVPGSEQQPNQPIHPIQPEVQKGPAAVEATAGQQEQTPTPDLSKLLDQPEMALTAIGALESEVAALRGTLGGLVSTGEMGVELLQSVAGGAAEQLKDLGVSDERAEAVRSLSNDVRALRARLRLMDLRAPTNTKVLVKDPNQGFDPLQDQATTEAEALAARLSEQRGSGISSARRQRSLYPSREALLAFKKGDYKQVVETLSPFELHEIEVEALYAFGCALVSERDFERARQVFKRVMSFDERQTFKQSSERQLSRMAYLENGIVGPGAQLQERNQR